MNHSKTKNFGMKTSRRTAVFNGMYEAYSKNGHITTTVAKAKALKSIIQSNNTEDKVFSVRVESRKGDNAAMMMLVSEQYTEKKFGGKKKSGKETEKVSEKKSSTKESSKKAVEAVEKIKVETKESKTGTKAKVENSNKDNKKEKDNK